jgi:hypothetical protein
LYKRHFSGIALNLRYFSDGIGRVPHKTAKQVIFGIPSRVTLLWRKQVKPLFVALNQYFKFEGGAKELVRSAQTASHQFARQKLPAQGFVQWLVADCANGDEGGQSEKD